MSHIKNKSWIKENCKIFIAKTFTKTDMDIYELYYINKLNPIHNIANSYGVEFSTKIKELEFYHYKTIKSDDIPKSKSINKEKDIEINIEYEEGSPFDKKLGYKLNKLIYPKLHKYIDSLDFIVGYEFQYSDCGHESFQLQFVFDTNKFVYIIINGNCGDLFLINDSVYYEIIKNTLIEIYKKDIAKDYVPCELTIYNAINNDVSINVYIEENLM